jgi:TRAP-type mannitol/chloroaromatic compound transport system permease small subunit
MLEGSPETSGLGAVYLLKSLIIMFAAFMALQGIAMALRATLTLKGLPVPTAKADGVDV